ncbi:Bgt-50248 [Blumeria graminis f. sp. tritici]|uniref:Bgt-50248 n=1 Tax=Blumeria graminis f. sp. tritici TaxID=62690 RepID=A0A9X9QH03_BLUGR|nr:Bgt-50248 [Blumeria graminis f. sp. tritici]
MDDIRAAVTRIKNSGVEWKSPNDVVQNHARKLGYKFLMPISVSEEWRKNGVFNYVTKDQNGDLNLWVSTTDMGVKIWESRIFWT